MTNVNQSSSLEAVIRSQERRKSQMQALRLFYNLYGMDTESTINLSDLNELLSSAFLMSEHVSAVCVNGGYRTPFATFGAEVLEDIGRTVPDSQDPSVLSYLSYAALNYLITRKFSNSRILAEDALSRMPNIQTDIGTLENFRMLLQQASLLLLSTDWPELRRVTTTENIREIAHTMIDRVSIPELTSGLLLLRSLHGFATFMQGNGRAALEAAETDLDRARRLGRHELLVGEIGDWLGEVYDVCLAHYAPTYLSKQGNLPEDYLRLLSSGAKPAYWLWPSQMGAFEAGLLSEDRFALSLPPSSGKTFLAEVKIIEKITKTNGLAFYVVPLNALARQAQRELSERLRQSPLRMNVRLLTGTYELRDEDLAAAGIEESIIVTTPEKLDGLLRNTDVPEIQDMLDRANMFVFDECQNIGSGKRGITLEMLIERIRFYKPEASILATAAFFQNISQFAEWLGNPDAYYLDDWRPTRRQVASWDKERGLLIDQRWRVQRYQRSCDTAADVTRIAMDLQRVYGNVLVAATTRANAEKYAEFIARAVSRLDTPLLSGLETRKLQILASSIRNAIHPNARLADFVGYGVAYHHAALPANIKSQIEDYIADGSLKFVSATTTLAQGVNFPIKSVVLSSIFFAGKPMDALDIQNIIGRAGRAGVSTAGQVIVLRNSEWLKPADRFYRFDDYCFSPPPELLTVRSSIPVQVGETFNRETFERFEALDSQILAFLGQSDFQDDDQVEKIAKGTFLSVQHRVAETGLRNVIEQRLEHMEGLPEAMVRAASPFQLTDFGRVVRKTGLGSTASTWTTRELERILSAEPEYFSTMRNNGEIDEEKLKALLQVTLFEPSNLLDTFGIRAHSKELFGASISNFEGNVGNLLAAFSADNEVTDAMRTTILDNDVKFLTDWINGASYQDLTGFFLKKPNPTQIQIDQAIEEVIHTVERYSSLLNWAGYYTTLLGRYVLGQLGPYGLSPELANLGQYVRWGVNHPVAVYLREMLNWDDRAEANAFGRLWEEEVEYSRNKSHLRVLLESVDEDLLLSILKSNERIEHLRQRLESV